MAGARGEAVLVFNQLKSDPLLRNSTSGIIEASKQLHHPHLESGFRVLCNNIASGSLSLWSPVLVFASETSIVLPTRSLRVAGFLWFLDLSGGWDLQTQDLPWTYPLRFSTSLDSYHRAGPGSLPSRNLGFHTPRFSLGLKGSLPFPLPCGAPAIISSTQLGFYRIKIGRLQLAEISKARNCEGTHLKPGVESRTMDLEAAILSEANQTENGKYHIVSLVWHLGQWYKWTHLQNRNRLKDMEHKLVIIKWKKCWRG